MQKRERLGSRLGFILISAGCAIGLGNVWRFPSMVGKYGGGAFILLYIVFLVIIGLPVLTAEFAVGRGSQRSIVGSFRRLEPKGTKWHIFGWFGLAGNYLLMMFYRTIAGWMLAYFFKFITGEFYAGQTTEQVKGVFTDLSGSPEASVLYMAVIVALGFLICSLGLKKGVERITKIMMIGLLAIIVVLVVRAVTLEGAEEGIAFYLIPDFERLFAQNGGTAVFEAMGQAFFTLSIGMGSMAIFGSYLGRERTLLGEAVNVTILDTFVAVMAGLMIFPACFAYGIEPNSGPPLIFETLPNVFNDIPGGRIWGAVFFLFMVFAALSTVVGVFENIMAVSMDERGWSRRKAALTNGIILFVLSVPAALGSNLLAGFAPFGGTSSVIELEDFIISKNIQPLGAAVYLLFCASKQGWGYENFIAEVDCGKGIRFPSRFRFYTGVILPLIIIVIFVQGYLATFS